MAVEAADLTLDDLDAVYPKRQLENQTSLDRLKSMAVNLTNEVYGGVTRGTAEIEGNQEDFALLVWAHFLALREGEPSSESQSGGSVAYARAQAGDDHGLGETRYGRQAMNLLGSKASLGIEKASSSWK